MPQQEAHACHSKTQTKSTHNTNNTNTNTTTTDDVCPATAHGMRAEDARSTRAHPWLGCMLAAIVAALPPALPPLVVAFPIPAARRTNCEASAWQSKHARREEAGMMERVGEGERKGGKGVSCRCRCAACAWV
eukprot:133070-Rhodomonas_salina.6